MSKPAVAVFAGCLPQAPDELTLARDIGRVLAPLAQEVRMGGYNGLMEELAKACADAGGVVMAPRLAGTEQWGAMNAYIDGTVDCATPGERLEYYLSADIVIGLPGGVGSLYEIAAALWHTTTYGPKPVLLLGARCHALYRHLVEDRWIVETPTRPTDHVVLLAGADELESAVRAHAGKMPGRSTP